MMKKFVGLFISLITFLGAGLTVCGVESQPGNITAKSAIIIEQSTGQTIWEKNSHEKLPIASITKVMVLLIAMEQVDAGKLNLDTTMIAGSKHAKEAGGSTIYLDEGESLPLRDIIKGICLNSGNDAAIALAEHIGGSENNFVQMMNDKAKQLGMNDTHFVNATGLDIDGHYSSANDVAIMSRELIKHSKILEFTSIWTDKLRGGKFDLANTNKLIKLYAPYADGLKTGSTDAAKYCLASTAKKDNMRLIAVVLGEDNPEKRFTDSKTLLEWGFNNYTVKSLGKAGDVMGEAKVLKGDKDSLKLVLKSDLDVVLKKSDADAAKREQAFEAQIKAPVANAQKVGSAAVKLGDKVIAQADIVTQSAAEKINFFQAFIKLIKMWLRFGS